MAQDLDISQFFRRAPKEWLRRYFDARGVLSGLEWATVSVRNIDAVMEAFLALDDEVRGEMVVEFAYIKLLATPAGKMQIIDEASYHGVEKEVAQQLADLDDIYACAFYVLLNHKACWDGAVFYAAADGKAKRYWRKRINLPRLGRLPTEEDGKALAAAITTLFRKKEGRGDHCVVRQLRRGSAGDREYYFAYPQDHKQNTIQYHDGEMAKRPYKPAFEIIFVHNDAEQTLAIWHQGSKERVKDLQQAFARAILRHDIPWDSPRDDRVYDLDRFLDRSFSFKPAAFLGITKAEVRKIGIRVLGDTAHLVSIELGSDTDSYVLGQRVESVTAGIPPTLCKVARIGCRITFEKKPGEERVKTRSFELAWPNSCSLQIDAHGILIQRMLADHGIEPHRQIGDGDDGHNAS